MKNILTTVIALLITGNVWAQAPNKMSYQALVRDGSNELVIDQPVGMQISILKGSIWGSAVYVETQTPTTNANGLVSLEIGSGTLVWGDFTTIDWSAGPYFIKTETDPTGGTNYTITGTSQLMSVPYAFYAKHVENVNDADADTTNEIQKLSVSILDDTLHLQNGGHVIIPGISLANRRVSVVTLSTSIISNILNGRASTGGVISQNGGAPITQRGVCYSTTVEPTTANNITNDGAGAGFFSSSLTSLSLGTKYYVRAYAINSVGTAYGNEISFTTTSNDSAITDADGNIYTSVEIGTQDWLVENLITSTYSDGTAILNVTDNSSWESLSTGAWSYKDNDNQYEAIYGKLYNGYAASDLRNICPTGWHVPTDSDWTVLTDYLAANGHNGTEGTALKATSGWSDYDGQSGNGIDAYGWLGLPGGSRHDEGHFGYVGLNGFWWSFSESTTSSSIRYLGGYLDLGSSNFNKNFGLSVRCLKD